MTDEERVDELLAEWRAAQDDGLVREPESLIREHPDLADSLRARFDALGALRAGFAALGDAPAHLPERIGDFRIVREIGRGGMGVVYEAEQVSMERKVALKLLSLSITGSRTSVQRFEREARAAGRLHHTNIVPVYAMGEHSGYWYYAMELVRGRPLNQIIEQMRGRPTERNLARAATGAPVPSESVLTDTGARAYHLRVAEMFAGVADALQLAHEERIIHRDVKPGNLLLDADGQLKLVDFGLARLDDQGMTMTATGDLLGTPAYMSPEQVLASDVRIDHRTDIYSLGASIYEALTLRPPFRGANLQELCSRILNRDPELPRRHNPRIPKDLETIVLKAMDKDRERRYATAGEFARDLRRFAEGVTIHARRVGPVGRAWRKVRRHRTLATVAAAAVLLAAVGVFLALTAARERDQRETLQYASLVRRADNFFARGEDAIALLQSAIALLPERPEAYLSRALIESRSLDQRLADLDEARERGLSARTFHLARADLFTTERRGDDARREQEAARGHPASTALDLLYEGRMQARRGDREQAIATLGRLLADGETSRPVRVLARQLRSAAYEDEEQFADALHDLIALEEAGDNSFDLRVRIAALWKRLGQPERADALFDALCTEARDVEDWLAIGDLAQQCREREWQERVTAAGLKLYRDDHRILMARALIETIDREERLRCGQRAAELRPDDPGYAFNLAGVLHQCEQPEAALEQIEKAIELGWDEVEAQNGRCAILYSLGRKEDARDTLLRIVILDPHNSYAHMNLGATLADLGELDAAFEAYDTAIRLDPKNARAHFNRGNDRYAVGDMDGAEKDYRRAVELNDTLHFFWLNLGRVLGAQGEHDDAIEVYGKAIALSDHPFSRNNRGVSLLETGEHAQALHDFERALELKPDYVNASVGVAWALVRLARYEDAVEAFEHAAQLGHDLCPDDLFLRAIAESGAGRRDDAKRSFDAAVAGMDTDDEEHVRLRQEASAALGN